jgi:hypothetical protein
MSPKEFDAQVIATTLMDVIPKVFQANFGFSFVDNPTFVRKEVIEYQSRMRVFGLEKFNGPCYISSISLYLTERHLQKQKPCGTVVVYVEPEYAVRFLAALGFKNQGEDEEDPTFEATIIDNCGEIANLIVGSYKNELANLGMKNLVISAPLSRKDSIEEGVEFPYSQYYYHELKYTHKKTTVLVVDCVMEEI